MILPVRFAHASRPPAGLDLAFFFEPARCLSFTVMLTGATEPGSTSAAFTDSAGISMVVGLCSGSEARVRPQMPPATTASTATTTPSRSATPGMRRDPSVAGSASSRDWRTKDFLRIPRLHRYNARGVVGVTRRYTKPRMKIRSVLRRDVLARVGSRVPARSEEHTSELQSRENLVCRLLLEKKKKKENSAVKKTQ